uniref:Uncharacterized protein n=1 Tax=Geospiza parvula TaxID=87175 RepID=A0A8C3MKX1_GEOPR
MALSPRLVALVALVASVALVAPPARGWDSDAPTATLAVTNGGQWGQWGDPEFCPGRGYARGFQLKVEPHKGFFGDDTGLNGVRLLLTAGDTGSCPPGQRLVSFRLRVEEPLGLWDDTAANAMAAICSGGSLLEGRGGPQGAWGNWSVPCPPGAGVCGLRTRLEPPQRGGDDTGLNDVELYCCS